MGPGLRRDDMNYHCASITPAAIDHILQRLAGLKTLDLLRDVF